MFLKLSRDEDEDDEVNVEWELPPINPPVLVTVVSLLMSLSEVSTGWGKFEEEAESDDDEVESDVEEPSLEFCAGCTLRGSLDPPNCLFGKRGERTLPFTPTPGRRLVRGTPEEVPGLVLDELSPVSTLALSSAFLSDSAGFS